jgi:DNA-directed RNA polymerase specialized sigma24 family protein
MADVHRTWTGITREQFIGALAALPTEFRAVFELRACGHAYDQIAARLAISREAVAVRLRLARSILRDLLLAPRLA